jgi:hypothetical protein
MIKFTATYCIMETSTIKKSSNSCDGSLKMGERASWPNNWVCPRGEYGEFAKRIKADI